MYDPVVQFFCCFFYKEDVNSECEETSMTLIIFWEGFSLTFILTFPSSRHIQVS